MAQAYSLVWNSMQSVATNWLYVGTETDY